MAARKVLKKVLRGVFDVRPWTSPRERVKV